MRRGTVMAALGALALGAIALGSAMPGRTQATPEGASSGRPDVLILVYQQPGQADLVDITYAHVVTRAQAQRDLAALAQATGWVVGPGRITNGLAPVQQKMAMTSTVLTIPGVIQNGSSLLPVGPIITAFRPYKRLALIFSVSPGFQFQGPRDYADNNVQITLEQHGTAYTYQARVLNPQFAQLNLPRSQAVVARRASPWLLFLGVLGAAAAAGVLVYVLMTRKAPPPPPRTNSDALAEGRAKIGT